MFSIDTHIFTGQNIFNIQFQNNYNLVKEFHRKLKYIIDDSALHFVWWQAKGDFPEYLEFFYNK